MVGLLEVQKEALRVAKDHRGFGYWLDMGLGKTLVALVEFRRMVDEGKATRLVVVCPNTFKSGWVDEIEKHGIEVDPWIYESGGDNDKFLKKSFTKPPVLIVNYEAIRRPNCQLYIDHFTQRRKCVLAFDESIQIKTHNSQQTKAAIKISYWFQYIRLLTGKPSTQGPHDLWAQLKIIGATSMNFWAFRNTFCRMGGYLNKKVVGVQNEEYLASIINPHVFRATKDQWTDLPPKVYTIRDVEMTAAQQDKYDSMEEEFVVWLKSGEEISVDMAITKHIKLAQIQFGFIINENGDTRILVDIESNPRLKIIRKIIEEEITGKVVVVYHHRYSAMALEKALIEYNPVFIRGGMGPDETSSNKDTFNNDPSCRVICIQTTAGRYGHTLIGGPEPENHCSTIIFAENTWSLDTRSQLEDRIHRHGQMGESCLYIDLSSSKLDRQIIKALQFKQNIFETVMKHVQGKVPA
jgi:SNF2 family DNA or RNA helicase